MDHNTPIAIIGAGLGGLASAIQLKQAGYSKVTIYEKAQKVGGTWAQNTYPGCSCDVPVALYQYSFAPAFHWTNTYPSAAEMQTYTEQLVAQFGLGDHLHLNTEITSLIWDDARALWTLTAANGTTSEAGAVISALGQLNTPMTPTFEGQSTFAGPTMHSAAWDHGVDMTGKRVGVIGSAASAVQLIPEVAKVAGHLTVFQRTPNYVGPRGDRKINASEVAMLMTNPAMAMDLGNRQRAMVFDTAESFFWQAFSWTPEGRAAYSDIARGHLEKSVEDADLRAKLTPNYPIGCKRFLFADNFYPALCLPHVTLETSAIASMNAAGLTTSDGAQHDLDIIVYATGFQTSDWQWSSRVFGTGGKPLSEAWNDGPQAYLGITTAGFPNFFMIYGPHTNLGHNSITYMIERQIGYILRALGGLSSQNLQTMDVKPAAQGAFVAANNARLANTVWADPTCNSWYKNDKGQITQNWAGNCTDYANAVAEVVWDDYKVTA